MISPIDNIIDFTWEYKVDALKNLSLSANASAIKYAIAYKDFKLTDPSKTLKQESLTDKAVYCLTKEHFEKLCKGYVDQDTKAKRNTSYNISVKDYNEIKKMFEKDPHCWLCGQIITEGMTLSFDRIDNKKPHTTDNIKFSCKECNVLRGTKDPCEARLLIQLRNYCIENNLPMTLKNETACEIIREGITGGLSIVHHTVNIKGKTHINHLKYENKKVISYDTEHIMTHVCGTDFNSLYPSSFSSKTNPNIPYTGGRMYMSGKITQVINCTAALARASGESDNFQELLSMILNNRFNEKGKLFIATVKGRIPEEYYNDFINFAPIIRNYEVETSEENIGYTCTIT